MERLYSYNLAGQPVSLITFLIKEQKQDATRALIRRAEKYLP